MGRRGWSKFSGRILISVGLMASLAKPALAEDTALEIRPSERVEVVTRGRAAKQPAVLTPGLRPAEIPVGPGSTSPTVYAEETGFILSWLEPVSPAGWSLRWARYDGARWSEAQEAVSGQRILANPHDRAGVVPLGNGRLLAYWLEMSPCGGHAYGVQMARSTDGGQTWGQPFALHDDEAPVEHGFVSVIPQRGGATIFWLDGSRSPSEADYRTTLWSREMSRDGELDEPRTLDGLTCDCCQTTAVTTRKGWTVFYRDRTEAEIRDISRVSKGRWWVNAAERLHDDGWEIAGCPVNGPQAHSEGKKVWVTWPTFAHDEGKIEVMTSADGARTFDGPWLLKTGDKPLGRVAISPTLEGEAMVAWLQRGERRLEIVTREVGLDGTLGPVVVRVQGTPILASGVPRLVKGGDALWLFYVDGEGVKAGVLKD